MNPLASCPAYKPSDVPWLGNVPEHWEVRTIGRSGPRGRARRPDHTCSECYMRLTLQ